MKAWGIDGLLHRHAVVNGVEQRQQHGGDDAAAAGCAQHHHRLAVLADNRRAHRRQRSFARGDGIGLALYQAIQVGHAGLGREVVHLVVQQDTGAWHSDLAAKPVVERVGHGDRIAPAVGN